MPSSYKILGQSNPAATTQTQVYLVPAATSAVVSTIVICNIDTVATYRISIIPSGQTLANRHYIVYDGILNQGESIFLTIGATLAAGDNIEVFASTANVSFSVFGSEIT